MATARSSDRYITPGVIIAAIVVLGLVLATLTGGVAYLTARGIDPDPMLKLVATVAAAGTSLVTMVLQLVGRATAAKTERNTGLLIGHTADLVDVVTSTPAPPPAPAPAAAPAPLMASVHAYACDFPAAACSCPPAGENRAVATEQQRLPVPAPVPARRRTDQ